MTVYSASLAALAFNEHAPEPRIRGWTLRELARRRRVYWLLLAIVLMGLADLACTLTYMRTSGMLELNPVARFMIETGGSTHLIAFKLVTTAVCCAAIIAMRRSARGEASAWICVAMMFALTIHWTIYNQQISLFTRDMAVLAMSGGEFEPRWIKLDE